MIRLSLLVTTGFVVAACSMSRAGLVTPPGARPVDVKVKCNKNQLDVSIKPFTVEMAPGDSIHWKPDLKNAGKNDVVVTIVPKDPPAWPFDKAPPTMPTDDGVFSGPLKSTVADTVSYSVHFECTINGVTRKFEIDPDIIISG